MNNEPFPGNADLIWRTETLGHLLRALRGERGFSIARLEALSGVGHSEIHRIETGQTECRLESLARLASSLGVTPGWLLDRSLWTNVSFFHRRILADAGFGQLLQRLGTGGGLRERLAERLAPAAALAALLLRCSDPISRARAVDFPHPDWSKRFLAFAATLAALEEGVDRAALLEGLLREPVGELSRQSLLPEAALRDLAKDAGKTAGRKRSWGWTPWLYQYPREITLSV